MKKGRKACNLKEMWNQEINNIFLSEKLDIVWKPIGRTGPL